ncbi:alpha/beta hydrolase [Nocardiopsis sp. NPDC006938]|uniref:alpha/beta hydrolase n=1 Tax=Nocardiopsis sp. NPDC006938 TaxID=3364337 RepID=UPI00367734CD
MGLTSWETEFSSLDGLRLKGTFTAGEGAVAPTHVVVLVHGGGVDREEGGFASRMADGLARAGAASLRFDLRGHGSSQGEQKDLTLSGVVNDIRSAVEHAQEQVPGAPGGVSLLGASFSGGLSAFYTAHYPESITALVLVNPLIDYKKRFIDDKPYWEADRIAPEEGEALLQNGFVPHSPTFRLGRALLNEVFYIRPDQALSSVRCRTLVIHGTADSFIPVESSRRAVEQIAGPARLWEIEGAQHGIAIPNDPGYGDPQTQKWQAEAITEVSEWVTQSRA